jgi:hypothetical protein
MVPKINTGGLVRQGARERCVLREGLEETDREVNIGDRSNLRMRKPKTTPGVSSQPETSGLLWIPNSTQISVSRPLPLLLDFRSGAPNQNQLMGGNWIDVGCGENDGRID